MTLTNRFALLLPLGLFLVSGCSSKGPVSGLSGNVKYKGTPVTAGTITFTAKAEGRDAGGTYFAAINSDGTYSTSQLPDGEFGVAIETESANPNRPTMDQYGGRGKGKMKASPAPDDAGPAAAAKGGYVKIPPKYSNPKTSGLSVTLTGGKNTQDFELTD